MPGITYASVATVAHAGRRPCRPVVRSPAGYGRSGNLPTTEDRAARALRKATAGAATMASRWTRRNRWAAVVAVVAVTIVAAFISWSHWASATAHPNHVVRDPVLRARGVVVYTPAGPPRSLVLFFGNDVGFWRPHHALAAELASDGYAVAGVDIRPLLASLPEGHPARDVACRAAVRDLVNRVRAELSLDSVPLIIGGHSLGAELALWTAANADLDGVVGTLALSPGSRSHLRVTASDILMTAEPEGPDSFGVAEQVARATQLGQRVAIVRGANDKFRGADASLIAAGRSSAVLFNVPFASHSLRDLTLARYVIRDAVEWLLQAHDSTAPRQDLATRWLRSYRGTANGS